MDPKTILDKISEGRQYRNFDARELRALGEDGYIVEGYAATFGQPYVLLSFNDFTVREQIDASAFDDADMSDVIMQFDHEGRVFARISNRTLQVFIDSHGLKIRADLGGTDIGRQLYSEIKGGYITKMSIGFKVKEDNRERVEDHETGKVDILRTITKISKLYDVSAVSLPANDATEISARSFGEGVIEELMQERQAHEKRERQKKKIKLMMEVNRWI